MKNKTAVVTGAAGFAGYSLTTHLLQHGYEVYAVVRPGSEHNSRLEPDVINKNLKDDLNRGSLGDITEDAIVDAAQIKKQLHILEVDSSDYSKLPDYIDAEAGVFFHLTWSGGRDDMAQQMANIPQAVEAAEAAGRLKCSRFIGTGSQAEYGVCNELISEEHKLDPINAYGSAKVAAMYLTKRRCEQLGIEWFWGRIFSLYGLYEPAGRMLPDLIRKLKTGETAHLSSCTQYWDYLDAGDAAEAFIAIAENGHNGYAYNIANGEYAPLKRFVRDMQETVNPDAKIEFGLAPKPFISLKPDITRLRDHTGWEPKVDFKAGIRSLI